jgi:hypothetical protein
VVRLHKAKDRGDIQRKDSHISNQDMPCHWGRTGTEDTKDQVNTRWTPGVISDSTLKCSSPSEELWTEQRKVKALNMDVPTPKPSRGLGP